MKQITLLVLFGIFLSAYSARAVSVTELKCQVAGTQLLASVEATRPQSTDNKIYVYGIDSELKLQTYYNVLLAIPSQFVSASESFVFAAPQLRIDARNPTSNEHFNFVGTSSPSNPQVFVGTGTYSYRDRRGVQTVNGKTFECTYGTYTEPK